MVCGRSPALPDKYERSLSLMLCHDCGFNNPEGAEYCGYCHSRLIDKPCIPPQNTNNESNTAGNVHECNTAGAEYNEYEEHVKHEVRVNAGIYKLICISMGLCLIAGSIVWASLLLRDRIDSPKTDRSGISQQADLPMTEEKETVATTAPKTETTTTTTTVDPFTVAVSPQFEDNYGTMYAVNDEVVMRIGPGYDYTKLDPTVPKGSAMLIKAEQADIKSGETWCYINYGDVDGWVCKAFLSNVNPTIAVVMPDEFYTGSDRTWFRVTRSGGLKLYAGPGEDYEVITTIDEGTELREEGYNYMSIKWLYTCLDGQYGWIATYDGDWFNPTISDL